MSKGNVKFFKNKNRSIQEKYQPYVPQYQLLGLEPEPFGINNRDALPLRKNIVTSATPSQKGPPASNSRRFQVKQPYAEAVDSPIGIGRGPIPNVGNSMEHSWTTVDGEVVNDSVYPPLNQNFIDNNDVVSDQVYSSMESSEIEDDLSVEEESSISSLADCQNYVLLLGNELFCAGEMDFIQEQARMLAFGEHSYCMDGVAIPLEEILIFKRVNVKVGLFIE